MMLLMLCLSSIPPGHAQEGPQMRSNNVLLGVNSDVFAGLELGYLRGSSLAGVPASYYITFNIPLLSSLSQKKLDSWELEIGAHLAPIRHHKYMVRTDLSLFAIRHIQTLGSFLPLGCKLKLTPALRTKNGYIGFQIRFQQVLCTYINPSEYVKERFEDIYNRENSLMEVKPKSGFYSFTGSHLYLGLEGMIAISGRLELYGDLGMVNYLSEYTGAFDSMMFGQIPLYTHIQLKYKLGKE